MSYRDDIPLPPQRALPGEALRSAEAMRRARRSGSAGDRVRELRAGADARDRDADWLFFIGRHFGPHAQRRPGRPDPTLPRHA